MALVKRSNMWYLDYWENGRGSKRIRVKLDTDKKGIAAERGAEMLKKIRQPVSTAVDTQLMLHTAIDDYLTSIVGHTKDYRNREKLSRIVKAFVGDKKLAELRTYDFESYREGRRAGKYVVTNKHNTAGKIVKDSTINREIDFFKAVFVRLTRLGLIESNPLKGIKKYSEKRYIRERVLSDEEFVRLYAECAEHIKPRVLIGYHTGMRKEEINGLALRDLTYETIYIPKARSKTGEERLIPLELFQPVKALIKNILDTHEGQAQSTPLFPHPVFTTGYTRACARARVENVTFHDLRHTAITNMYKRSFPEKIIMKISGHKTRSAFDRYVNLQSKDLLDFARGHMVDTKRKHVREVKLRDTENE